MKKKMIHLAGMIVLTAGLFAGCGAAGETAESADTTVTEEESADTESADVSESAVEETAEDTSADAEEETGIQAPIITDLSSYDSIISQLEPGQAYAFADMDADNDALLVTSYVYDNLDGNIAAIDAEIYGFDSDGNIIDYGPVMSAGTAYPLSIYDGMLIFGSGHHVGLEYIDESVSSIVTKEDASEEFDTNGNATYYYFSYDDQFEGEVEDDSHLTALFDKYAEAVVINFTVVE